MNFDTGQLEKVLAPIVKNAGCDLIEIKCGGRANRPIIQVFVDRDAGINIDDCTRISRQITDVLDMTFPDVPQYRLEVSSPGVHRPLKTVNDFSRNIGKVVRIQYDLDEKESSVEGRVVGIEKDYVRVMVKDQVKEIPLRVIRQARIQLKW